jgi:hypothetical protein
MDLAETVPASTAAMRMGLTSEQLRRRILRQEIRAELVAGRWLIEKKSLEEWIAQNQQSAPAA